MSVAALITAVVLLQAPTIEMTISSNGTEIGKAWLTQKLDASGKKTHAKLILGEVRIVETAEYAMDGTPKSKVLVRTEGGRDMRIEARFQKDSVKLTAGDVSTIKFPSSGSLQAKSEFWFLQTKPPVNHVAEYQRFDMSTGKFSHCKVVYLGKDEITIAGKKVEANKVRIDNKTDAWLDDRGDPYRMVLEGGTRFERVSK